LALSAARNLTVEVASFAAAPALNDTQGARNATAPLRLPLAAAPANSATNVSGWRWDPLAPRGGGGGGGSAGDGAVWFVFLWLRDAGGGLLSRILVGWLVQTLDCFVRGRACGRPRRLAAQCVPCLRVLALQLLVHRWLAPCPRLACLAKQRSDCRIADPQQQAEVKGSAAEQLVCRGL